MIVYNLTIKINNDIHHPWVQWQREDHIPEIMATGLFKKYEFYRLLEQDDSDGPTYIVQYFTDSKEKYDQYISKHASHFNEKAIKKWANGFIAFRTLFVTVQ